MPLTDQDIRALTFLASRCRPPGAPPWDEAGIAAAIAKVRHLHLADVALATIRAADDPTAKTPGVIANPTSPNWRERGTDRPHQHEPFERDAICGWCSRDRHICEADPIAGHAFESIPDRDARVARERAARQETE